MSPGTFNSKILSKGIGNLSGRKTSFGKGYSSSRNNAEGRSAGVGDDKVNGFAGGISRSDTVGQIKKSWLDRGWNALAGDKRKNEKPAVTGRAWQDGKISKKLLGAQVKVDKNVKAGEIKYNHRKNTISISENTPIDKRELPEQILKLAKSSRRFRETTGIGTVTSQKRRIVRNMFQHKDTAISRVNSDLLSSATKRSSSKSSQRKVELRKIVNKKYIAN